MFKKFKSKINTKKKRGFSEKLILLVIIWVITVFERALYYSFKNYSENIWMYIIPAVGTILGSCFAFFTWKAKSENVIKISNNPEYDEEKLKEQIYEQAKQEYIADYINEFSNIGRS